MPSSRFGASKWRNATIQVSARTDWVRQPSLATNNNSSSSIGTFNSEVKANRQYIVTLTQAGDLVWRSYENLAELGTAKLRSGGDVGDWDLGGLEGGQLVVGGLDGTVRISETRWKYY
jgi:hypothetical protein